jgi:uncharacterized protein
LSMFNRTLSLPLSRSFFLFGPRSTGKSTLLRLHLPESKALWLDLLDPRLERELARDPSRLSAFLESERKRKAPRKWVVIDEVQKVPELLSLVHQWIGKKQFHFAMTGSSARKLKRGGADLLGGRASWFELYSLAHDEIGDCFNLSDVLRWGSLPEIFELSPMDRVRFLQSYAQIYLKEEVIAEQLIRKIQPFRNFIELAAIQNAQIINYSNFARDCNVDVVTIQSYFEILQDTLVGFELPAYHASIRKRQRTNPKFYFFDNGVVRALAGSLEDSLRSGTSAYGLLFEQFVVSEIFRMMKAREKSWRLSYLTTRDGAEIDLIIEKARGEKWAIEIKSSNRVDPKEVSRFERLTKDIPEAKALMISQDLIAQRFGTVECLPWLDALKMLLA